MLKATLRSAVLLGLTALGVFASSTPSFAEVQNVRVGGDVTVRAFIRQNLDLHQEDDNTGILDTENFLMQTTAVNVGADLTENVSAFIRIANERNWDLNPTSGTNTASGDIDISQAYITLKELFYSPLTLRVGSQPIVWGRGFVLGSNLLPSVNGTGDDRNASISANEFTDFTAFDAIRATLDLSGIAEIGAPLSLDYVYIKQDENAVGTPDDVNLQGINLSARFDSLNSELETYYLNKRDKNTGAKDGSLSTLGFRGSSQPIEGSSLWGELAYQFGERVIDPAGILVAGDAAQGWAANLGLDFTFSDVAMTPKVGGEWRFYKGHNSNGAVAGWTPIAPGYFTTALRDFQTSNGVAGFYANDQTCFAAGAAGRPCTAGQSNQHEWSIFGSLKPIEDLTVAPRLSWFFLDVGALPSAAAGGTQTSKRKGYAGMEWDTAVTYNYTDDVQLGLIYALFAPGNVYRHPNDNTAQELVTSVSVKF